MVPATTRAYWTKRPATLVSVAVCVVYFGVAQVVQNFYPFSVYAMYAPAHDASGSRIVAHGRDGVLHEVTDYREWNCDRDPRAALKSEDTQDFYSEAHHDAELIQDVLANEGNSGSAVPVDLVRHIWRFGKNGQTKEEEHLLAHCTAVRR